MFSGGLNAASTLSVVIVVIYGANLTINGYMTTGSLTSFILYSLTGTFHINSIYIEPSIMLGFVSVNIKFHNIHHVHRVARLVLHVSFTVY